MPEAPVQNAPDALRQRTLAELTLLLTPGLGPVLATRLIEHIGSPDEAMHISEAALRKVQGIGPARASAIRAGLADARDAAQRELERAQAINARILTIDDHAYPELLRSIPNPPRLLFIRDRPGATLPAPALAIVGTRRCTAYGIEQAERFAAAIASAGITIVSGGARGIDTAAHRATLRIAGRTVAVLGCGLAHAYPPENRELFDRIVDAGGAIISELPIDTPPAADNFPARNRIISGMALGVLVIEAPLRSGSLITARQASDEQGREVMVVPGRIDSPASAGSLELIRDGAALITSPADVIASLESSARHQFHGSHALITMRLFDDQPATDAAPPHASDATASPADPPDDEPAAILAALREAGDLDAVVRRTGLPAHRVRAHLTMLELSGRITRRGPRFDVRH